MLRGTPPVNPDEPWTILEFRVFQRIRLTKVTGSPQPEFPRNAAGSRGWFGSFLNFLRVCMGWGRCNSRENRRNVVKLDPPEGLLVHGVWSPVRPRPGSSKRGKMEEECFAPCEGGRKGPKRPERGGPVSPKRPQRCQETTRLEKKRCLGKTQQKWFWSPKWPPQCSRGLPRWLWIDP